MDENKNQATNINQDSLGVMNSKYNNFIILTIHLRLVLLPSYKTSRYSLQKLSCVRLFFNLKCFLY